MDPDDEFLREPGADPSAVGDLLASLAARRRWQAPLAGGDLQSRWPEVVGETVAAHSAPVRLKGGVLVVRADSPAWATQLRYLATEIGRQVNAAVGSELVREVHVTGSSSARKKRS